jgi:single-stranded-DNA-specific exonuclease
MSHYKWICRPQDNVQKRNLEVEFGGRSLLTETLVSRGILSKQSFLEFTAHDLVKIPAPDLLKDLNKAAERIAHAILSGECIVIHGDYDVDGISATSLLVRFFGDIKVQVQYFIPNRFVDGYGVSRNNIEKIKSEFNPAIVITVDCGITAVEAALSAKENKIDLIITDHHEPGECLPDAFAVINPRQANCHFPDKDISGVGVAYYLVIAVRRMLRQEKYFAATSEPNLRAYLDYVALGTIADISPLSPLNRTFIWHGLKLIEGGGRQGILALKEVSGLSHTPITYASVAFKIAPRLNAAGRMTTALKSLEVLISTDFVRASLDAHVLDEQNTERRAAEAQVLKEAIDLLEQKGSVADLSAIVLAKEDWHEGVLGIVCSRLVEKYYRPTILISFNGEKGKGSARGIADLDLLACIQKCAAHLISAGGHKSAAGLSLVKDDFETFRSQFQEEVSRQIKSISLSPKLLIDGQVYLEDISFLAIKDLVRLSPFGPGNPEPTFSMKTKILQKRIVGQNHLKLTIGSPLQQFDAIGFGLGERESALKKGSEIEMAFQPKIDTFRGVEKISLHIRDLK